MAYGYGEFADCFEAPPAEQHLLVEILRERRINVSKLKKYKVWVRPDGRRAFEFSSDDYCSIGDKGIKEIPKEFTRRRNARGLPEPTPPPRATQGSVRSGNISGYVGDIPIVQTSPRSYLGDLDDSPEFGDD
jgi:hypothetical protein